MHGKPPISSEPSCPCPCDLPKGLHTGCGRAYKTHRRTEYRHAHACLPKAERCKPDKAGVWFWRLRMYEDVLYEAAGLHVLAPPFGQLSQGWPRIEGSDRCYGAPICTVNCTTRLSESPGRFVQVPLLAYPKLMMSVRPLSLSVGSEIFRLLVRDLGTNRSA